MVRKIQILSLNKSRAEEVPEIEVKNIYPFKASLMQRN